MSRKKEPKDRSPQVIALMDQLRAIRLERARLAARELELDRQLLAACDHSEALDQQGDVRCSFLDEATPCRLCPTCMGHLHR